MATDVQSYGSSWGGGGGFKNMSATYIDYS